jgi:hypothetical protein
LYSAERTAARARAVVKPWTSTSMDF